MYCASMVVFLFTCFLGPSVFADEIKLFIWEEYLSSEVINDFEKQSGHSVKQIYFESEMLRDSVVHSGKATAYDLFIVDSLTLKILAGKGILSQLGRDLLSDSYHFRADANTACGEYGVPYAYGSMGIGYRSSKVNKPLNSWMDVFEYAKQVPGSVVIPDEDIDTNAIALMALGYHPMSNNQSELKEAYQLLVSVIDKLLVFRNSAGYAQDKKEQSKMDVAIFYSGEKESIAKATGQDDWVYTIPKEGTLLWYECLASHVNKPMNPATVEFIKFINKPSNAIKNAQDMWFATLNKDALKLADDEYLNDSELFPVNLSLSHLFHYEMLDEVSLKTRAKIVSVLSKD